MSKIVLPPPGATVAVDTEGSGLYVDDGARMSVLQAAWREGDLLVTRALPLAQRGVEPIPSWKWEAWVARLLRCRLVFWNALHDIPMISAGVGGFPGVDLTDQVCWDGMVAEALLSPGESRELEACTERLLGESAYAEKKALKAWLAAYGRRNKLTGISGRYDLVDWEVMKPYALADARRTLKLCEFQWEAIETGWSWTQPLIETDIALVRVLCKMEQRGIGYAAAESQEAARLMRRRIATLKKALPFEPTTAGARAYFFGRPPQGMGLIPHKVTASGIASVDADSIRKLLARNAPGAREYAEYQKVTKATSSWYAGFAVKCGEDGRLRTRFTISSVISNRLSSRRVNLQALPHDYRLQLVEGVPNVRTLFRARPGFELWELDLSQAEVRVAAAVSECRGLRQAIETGDADLHGATARMVFKVDDTSDDWFRNRQISKRLNFGMIYGAGARTLVETLAVDLGYQVSESEARRWKDQYDRAFPELRRAYNREQALCEVNGYVRLVSGRMRWFRLFEHPRKAFNQKIQGGVAEAMKFWMIALEARWPGALVLQIHDSMVVELPEGSDRLVSKMAAQGRKIFRDLFGIPFLVDCKRWSKE